MTATSGEVRSPSDADLALNPFDTVADRPDVLLTAQLEGRLMFDGNCIVIKTSGGLITPLWPEGTRVAGAAGRHVVTLPDGRGSATIGTKASLSGGTLPVSDVERLAQSARAGCPSTYFAVSTVK